MLGTLCDLRHLSFRVAVLNVLMSLQPSMGLPPLLPLLWQGMLSFASSAALDEMFGAHASAAKGYAKAATLAELLQRQSADSKASPRGQPREQGAQQHRTQTCGGAGTAALSAGSSAGDVPPQPRSSSFEQQVTNLQITDSQQRAGQHSAPLRAEDDVSRSQSIEQGHTQGSLVTSGSGAGGMMFPDDLQEHHTGTVYQLAGWGLVLDPQKHQQLQGYIKTIAKRHASCTRPR